MKIRKPFDDISLSPEMTSLIDMMFLLIIFFMLTSTFESEGKRQEIPIDLPQSSRSQPVYRDDAVVLGVGQKGEYLLGGKPCAAENLADGLSARVSLTKDSVVIISAHRSAPFASIVFVYDVLQSVGIRRFSHEVQ